MANRKKIAVICTMGFRHSHVDVIVPKFVTGFPTDEGLIPPQVEISSLYIDQVHDDDVIMAFAKNHDIPIFRSIRSALTLGGHHWRPSDELLAVDGVLLIAEHGDYGQNEKDQTLYPKRSFFEQICGVFARSGRSVPVFCDKYLSYDWPTAKWMYDRAQQLNVPFMAGSSLPLCYRKPWLEYEIGVHLDQAVSIGWHQLESYGYHALELLQCMVERRAGGEVGIAAVQCLEGDAVWQAGRDGLWSQDLVKAADDCTAAKNPGQMEDNCPNPAVFLLEYADGFRAATLMLTGHLKGWGFAGLCNGQIQATEVLQFDAPYPNPHFSYLGLNIEQMFLTGQPQYPVERTLLVSGVLDALLESRHQGHQRIETPHLRFTYEPRTTSPIRPTGTKPTGAAAMERTFD